jgi:hypothetical protein
MLDIYDIQSYEDRGIKRYRIAWRDGDASGIADSHCSLTGVPLGDSYTECVNHCREHGQYSKEVDTQFHYFGVMRMSQIARAKSEDEREHINAAIDNLKDVWLSSSILYTQSQNTKPVKYATIIGTPFS